MTGLPGVRPAVGFHGSGRVPVLDVRCLWSRVHSHRGIKACEVCLSWVASGSADAPLHQLCADVGVLLIEGMQILQVLPVVGRPASKWVWRTADVLQVWQLEVPFAFLAKGPSMSQPHAANGRCLARAPRFSLSSPGTGSRHWLSRQVGPHPFGCGPGDLTRSLLSAGQNQTKKIHVIYIHLYICLLYTSPSPRDLSTSRMPSSA